MTSPTVKLMALIDMNSRARVGEHRQHAVPILHGGAGQEDAQRYASLRMQRYEHQMRSGLWNHANQACY